VTWPPQPASPSVELLRTAAGPDRGADELVTLHLASTGDLVLRAVAIGIAVERFEGDGRNKRTSSYTVRAGDVPRIRSALLRDLFAGTSPGDWFAAHGIPAVAEQWHGYDRGPVDEDRFLLEGLRDVIGTAEWDEGEKIALRFIRWLSRHGIEQEFREEVGEAD
jgi:hypothetical protein